MKLFKTKGGIFLEGDQRWFRLNVDWDELINRDHLYQHLEKEATNANTIDQKEFHKAVDGEILAPIGNQEVWGAGVTYLRSRDARMEEAKDAGNADCYQKVYEAERPELFFKALPKRVAGPGEEVYIRKDAHWNVPEPELTIYINSNGKIQGYTIGNDMSSRDIEGENPLYLPQAKMYERSAALGPCLYVPGNPISKETLIKIIIDREKKRIFEDTISLGKMKRSFTELAGYLYRECAFEYGCYLMTGTGIIPPADFSLQLGDRIDISIEGIGSLHNTVGTRP